MQRHIGRHATKARFHLQVFSIPAFRPVASYTMTRTSRAAYPRALDRDRSQSRTGLPRTLRKCGAGSHNWGSLADEGDLEAAALADEKREIEELKSRLGEIPEGVHSCSHRLMNATHSII